MIKREKDTKRAVSHHINHNQPDKEYEGDNEDISDKPIKGRNLRKTSKEKNA